MRAHRLAVPMFGVMAAAALLAACTSADSSGGSGDSDPFLVRAGYSFGMCGGPCVGNLIVDGSRASLVVRGHFEEEFFLENSGKLTSKALGMLQGFRDSLADSELQDVYGCPDCADGGAAYVALRRDGVLSQHSYDFGRPPPVLAPLDRFTGEVMLALEYCSESELVVIEPGCVPRE